MIAYVNLAATSACERCVRQREAPKAALAERASIVDRDTVALPWSRRAVAVYPRVVAVYKGGSSSIQYTQPERKERVCVVLLCYAPLWCTCSQGCARKVYGSVSQHQATHTHCSFTAAAFGGRWHCTALTTVNAMPCCQKLLIA